MAIATFHRTWDRKRFTKIFITVKRYHAKISIKSKIFQLKKWERPKSNSALYWVLCWDSQVHTRLEWFIPHQQNPFVSESLRVSRVFDKSINTVDELIVEHSRRGTRALPPLKLLPIKEWITNSQKPWLLSNYGTNRKWMQGKEQKCWAVVLWPVMKTI